MKFTQVFLLATLAMFTFPNRGLPVEQSLLYTVPFKAGDEGAKIYRIPALWWQPKKPLLAFAERRMEHRQMHGNIDIVLRRSLDNGQTWEPQQIVADLASDACGNPCIVHDASRGKLWLAFTRSRQQDIEKEIAGGTAPGTQVWIASSEDDGASWSAPKDISATCRKPTWGWYGTGPGQGLYLRGGNSRADRLLIPCYHTEEGVYTTHCIYSDDHGETWQLGRNVAPDTSEPQVIEMDGHTLLMNARAVGGRQRGLHVSLDRGISWQPASEMAPIPDNQCQGYLYRCFRNGSAGEYDWIFTQPVASNRTGVHAWISEDRGKSWPFAQSLWTGPSAYTAMTRVQGGLVGVLLECGNKDVYEQIVFLKFAPEWLRGRKAPFTSALPP